MNRENCEKLLDSYESIIVACEKGVSVESDDGFDMGLAHDNMREVIVGIMADEKKPAYRDGGVVVRDAPIQWPGITATPTTIPAHVTKPIITCDGKDEYTERF